MNLAAISPAEYTRSLFGTIIKNRRKELKFSIRELAKRIDITPAYLSDIEHSNRYPPIENETLINNFITMLAITGDEEISAFRDIAYFGRYGVSKRIVDYLASNKFAMETISLAEKLKISDRQWISIVSALVASCQDYSK